MKDIIIRVDRSIQPVYPDYADKKFLESSKFTALERFGPTEYKLSEIKKISHGLSYNEIFDQPRNRRYGYPIYKILEKQNLLRFCLGLSDLVAIETCGIGVVKKCLDNYGDGSLRIPAWKSVFWWKEYKTYVVPNLSIRNNWKVSTSEIGWNHLLNDAIALFPILIIKN